MAKIGLKGFWAADYAEADGGITYSNGKKVAKAVSLNTNRTVNEATLYGDNALDDSAYAITAMTIDMTPTGLTGEELEEFIGLVEESVTINGEAETVKATTPDNEGTEKGIGIIEEERSGGTVSYKATIFARVKFRPSESEEAQTKGENMTFTTPAYRGQCYTALGKYYTFEDSFESEDLAVAFIEKIFAISSTLSGVD